MFPDFAHIIRLVAGSFFYLFILTFSVCVNFQFGFIIF